MRRASAKKVVFDDAVDRTEAVLVADLLSLFIGPAMVGDADLVDSRAAPGQLGGDFRLEAEPVFLDLDRLDELAAECLIAGFHVREIQVGEHVGKKRQESVPDAVPEVEVAMRI